jgi:hypothetical protein
MKPIMIFDYIFCKFLKFFNNRDDSTPLGNAILSVAFMQSFIIFDILVIVWCVNSKLFPLKYGAYLSIAAMFVLSIGNNKRYNSKKQKELKDKWQNEKSGIKGVRLFFVWLFSLAIFCFPFFLRILKN